MRAWVRRSGCRHHDGVAGRQPTSRSRSRITAASAASGPSAGVTVTVRVAALGDAGRQVGVDVIARREEGGHHDRRCSPSASTSAGLGPSTSTNAVRTGPTRAATTSASSRWSAGLRDDGCRGRPGSACGRVDRQPVAALDDGLDRTPVRRAPNAAGPSRSPPRGCRRRRRAAARAAPPATPPTRDCAISRRSSAIAAGGTVWTSPSTATVALRTLMSWPPAVNWLSATRNLVADQPGQRTEPVAIGMSGRHTEPSQRRRGHRADADRGDAVAQRGDEVADTAKCLGALQH